MENLNEALAAMINTALAGIDTSTEFLQAQLPDVIVQLLEWNFTLSILLCALSLLILISAIILEVWMVKKVCLPKDGWWRDGRGDIDMDALGVYWAFGTILRLVYIVPFFLYFNLTWLQIWIAPKVWLLEYAADLVK